MRVAIIGAGVSGIAALKCCMEENLTAVCFEQNETFGGLWEHNANPVPNQTTVTKQVVCNTSKEMMAFSDFPPPQEFPLYLPQYKYKEYLQLYVKNFDLEKHMKFNKKVYASTRNGRWIGKRLTPVGLPLDIQVFKRVNRFILKCVPRKFQQLWFENILALSHKFFGLIQKSDVSAKTLTINDDVIDKIACGKVIVKPNVEEFTAHDVSFADGTVASDIDVVIFATGYEIDFPFLENSMLKMKDGKLFAYKHMFPPEMIDQNVAIIDCMYIFGVAAPLHESQCRLATQVFKGFVKLPPKEVILEEINATIATQRNVDAIGYQDELCELIGCKPKLCHLLLSDFYLGLNVFVGPCTAYQYRLTGPGKWAGARSAILGQWKRMHYPTNKHLKSSLPPWIKDFLIVFVIFFVLIQFLIFRIFL